MKVNRQEYKDIFTPFSVTIEFETMEEAQEMFCLFNFSPITDGLKHIDWSSVRDSLGDVKYGFYWASFRKSIWASIKKYMCKHFQRRFTSNVLH